MNYVEENRYKKIILFIVLAVMLINIYVYANIGMNIGDFYLNIVILLGIQAITYKYINER